MFMMNRIKEISTLKTDSRNQIGHIVFLKYSKSKVFPWWVPKVPLFHIFILHWNQICISFSVWLGPHQEVFESLPTFRSELAS